MEIRVYFRSAIPLKLMISVYLLVQKCFDYRQSCAVESTARHNPDVDVVVFLRADKVPANCSTFRQFIQPEIAEFKNVKIIQYDLAGLFKDTPLFQWGQDVEEDRIKSKYMSAHLSDALRLALAHKYHAAYVDLDFIVSSNGRSIPFDTHLFIPNEENIVNEGFVVTSDITAFK